MSDGKCDQKGEGTALIWGMPVVIQLSNSGSMGVVAQTREEWPHHAIVTTPLFTPMGFGVTPYQLMN